jgi:hypothetical protein
MQDSATGNGQGTEAAESAEDYTPKCRESYPSWVPWFVWALLGGITSYVCVKYFLFTAFATLVAAGLIAVVVSLWWSDTQRVLKRRLPPSGWKSQIMPEKLVYMTLENFDGMRFEFEGEDEDELENHRVRWVTRFSKDILILVWLCSAAAPLCLVGAVLLPTITTPGTGGELSQEHHVVWVWVALALALAFMAFFTRLEWDYKRLMLTDKYLYCLKENPAWLPWFSGKNDPFSMDYVIKADPIDSHLWGNRWGHGTVKITIQEGLGNLQYLYFRRVPNHREFCNALNGMVVGDRSYMGRMMY